MTITRGHTGGCQCGAIRYRLLGTPVAVYACHCRLCQQQSASAFGMSMLIERNGIEFSGAEPRVYLTSGTSGRPKHCAFCGECGTRLYHTGAGARSILSIKAGSLDDTSVLTPTCHLWIRSAQPWVAPLLKGAVCFDEEPDSNETLRAQLRAATAGADAGGSTSC